MSKSYKKYAICVDQNRGGKKRFFKRQASKRFRHLTDFDVIGKSMVHRRFYNPYKITDYYMLDSKESHVKFQMYLYGATEEEAINHWEKYFKRK